MAIEADVAQQVVSQGLQVTEHAGRLAGLGIKNLVALLMALAQSHRKTHGKTALTDLVLGSGSPQTFEMTNNQAKKFQRLAKEHGVTAIPIRDKSSKDNMCNVIVRGEDSACVNLVFEKMGYAVPKQEKDGEVKNADTRAGQGNESPSRGNILNQSQTKNPNRTSTTTTDGKMPVRDRVSALKAASQDTAKAGQLKSRGTPNIGKSK
ncbi:MAG: PcfB family protein [Oscillospiraceae bacterium]|nr:PcfB family protein [Oscillospiraceae bacterium]